MLRILISIILLFCFGSSSFAQDIEVTSNADSGPGTFREALSRAAANGTGSTDRIIFKLQGNTIADRSIQTNTALPALSSNLVIDGTTQTGPAFGVTDAKVKILCNNDINLNRDPILKGEAVDRLEIYGLWLENLNEYAGSNGALVLENSGKIVIGGADKGNYFRRNYILIDRISEFVFQRNICFTTENGNLGGNNTIKITGVQKALIGGSTATGNLISGAIEISGHIYLPGARKQIEISYNNMGASYDQAYSDQTFRTERSRIQITGSTDNGGQLRYDEHEILIKNNILANSNNTTVVKIENVSGGVNIQGNGFDTDLSGVRNYALTKYRSGAGITLNTKANCLVGGENPGEGNIMRSQIYAIYNSNRPEGRCQVSRNRMYCLFSVPYYIGFGPENMPVATITSNSLQPLQGIATPLSKVELFYDDNCDGCTPETYFATVTAGADGKWVYNGPVNGTVIASATLNEQTSEFTRAVLNIDGIKVTHAGCGLDNGKISGIDVVNSKEVSWLDEQGQLVGTTLDIDGLKPGRYKLVLGSGSCQASSEYITIYDATPVIDDRRKGVSNPTCGQSNGTVNGLDVSIEGPKNLTYAWYNQNNEKVGDAGFLTGVPAGSYTLSVSTPGGCTKTYGPITLRDQPGPKIDLSSMTRLSSPCGGTTGRIFNISVQGTGRISYRWLDQNNVEIYKGIVGPDKDAPLNNAKPGFYRLEVKDERGCPPVFTEGIEVRETGGFTIDETLASPKDEDCMRDNGGIIGIVVKGANKLKWLDEEGNTAGTKEDLTGVKAGKYHLVATNDNNCTQESRIYEIKGPVRIAYSLSAKVTNVDCHNDIGTIELTNTGPDEPVSYRWVDANNNELISGTKLIAAAGVYTLYITDANNCEYIYANFPIQDQVKLLSKPLVNDVKVCGTGPVTIQVSNAQSGSYHLYDRKGMELAISTTGVFSLNLTESAAYTILLEDGNCESPPAIFSVSVEQGGLSDIANTFSPNGDGQNDLWTIPGLASSPDATVAIYNREGVAVFKSKGYQKPFDGRYLGTDLPVGVYYYVIDLKRTCGVLTGSLTLIR